MGDSGPIAIVSALTQELAVLRGATAGRPPLDLGLAELHAWHGLLDGQPRGVL